MSEDCGCGTCERTRALLTQYEERREEARVRTDERRYIGDIDGEYRAYREQQEYTHIANLLRTLLYGPQTADQG